MELPVIAAYAASTIYMLVFLAIIALPIEAYSVTTSEPGGIETERKVYYTLLEKFFIAVFIVVLVIPFASLILFYIGLFLLQPLFLIPDKFFI